MTDANSPNPENPYQPPTTAAADEEANSLRGLGFTAAIASSLKQMQPWIRFLSIIGFIGAGLMVLGGLGAGIAMAFTELAAAAGVGLLYVGFGVLYFFPALHLYHYSGSLKTAINEGAAEELEKAFGRAKSFWKFMGVWTIVAMAVAVLAVVVAMIVGITQAFG